MPKYIYKAKTETGEDEKGEMTVESESELAHILRKKNLILVSARKKADKEKLNLSIPFLGGVSLSEKLMLVRNLKVMTEAGLSLPRALEVLEKQSENKKLSKTLEEIRKSLLEGNSFSESLKKYPDIFSDMFSSMVEVGEAGGDLAGVLDVLSRQMEREHKLKSEIIGALIYPAVIIIAMLGIGLAMLVMVVPSIAETFEELGIDLPATTRFVIGLGNTLTNQWYLFIVGGILSAVIFAYILRTKQGKTVVSFLSLHFPMVSSLIRKVNSAYTLRSLSSLIAAGVSLPQALEIASGTATNVYFKEALNESAEKVIKGENLSQSLSAYENIYPTLVIQMIVVGEETGESIQILDKLSSFFEEQVTRATKNIASVVEPIIMLLIGGAVGFFAISMIQPMYAMLGALQ